MSETVVGVTAIILDECGRLLLGRRAPGKKCAGLWETPGGRIEPGEFRHAALRRELREELDLDVVVEGVDRACVTVEVDETVTVELHAYELDVGQQTPAIADGSHDALEWVNIEQLRAPDFALTPGTSALMPAIKLRMWVKRCRYMLANSTGCSNDFESDLVGVIVDLADAAE